MLVIKQKYYFLLLIFLLLPFSIQAAWSEPVQAPPGGNAALPVYTTGTNQTIDGTLHVGTPGSYATGLQGSGSTNGIQGNSAANALFGNLAVNGAGGNRAVYGLAVDAADYGLFSGGGMGLGFASGDIWFIQQDSGIAWPRESDGQGLYGIMVNPSGELQVRGHGGGINFMNQTPASLMTISEAGATNVVNGPLTVGGTSVCLQSGSGCPATASLWAQNGSHIYNTNAGNVGIGTSNPADWGWGTNDLDVNGQVRAGRFIDDDTNYYADLNSNANLAGPWAIGGNIPTDGGSQLTLRPQSRREGLRVVSAADWSPLNIRNNADSGDLFRVDQSGNVAAAGNITVAGQNVCRQNGVNCPAVGTPNLQQVTTSGNTTTNTLNLQGALSNSLGDLVINDWVDVQWGLKNSTANSGGKLFVNDDLHSNYNFTVKGLAAFGDYAIDASRAITTPTLYANQARIENLGLGKEPAAYRVDASGNINATQLCIQGDCKPSWAAVATSAGWSDNGDNVYLTDSANFVGIGVIPTPAFVKLRVYPQNYVEGLRIKSSNYSPFIVRDSTDSQDFFRINETGAISSYADMNINSTNGSLRLNDNTYISGNLNVAGIDNRIGGAYHTVPLAIKTDTQGNGVVIECGMGSCSNTLEFRVTNQNYAVIDTFYDPGATNLAINPSPYPGYNGGNVGIGTTNPNKQLHIKTDHGNAEIDIQTANSPYWGIYQDDGTNDLRFWNVDDRLTLKTNGALMIGGSQDRPTINSESAEGEDSALTIKNALGQIVAQFGADMIMQNRRATIFRDWVYFTSDSGPTVIAAGGNLTATGNVQGSQMCISGNCKTGWGANSGQRVYVNTSTPGDNVDYVCPAGYVMTGIKNSSPGQLICDRMW